MRVKSVLRNLLTTQTSTAWNCTSRNQVRLTNCSKSNKTIFQVKDEFSKQSKELRDSWDVQDRKTDMSEVQAQLDVYANSVTDKGATEVQRVAGTNETVAT